MSQSPPRPGYQHTAPFYTVAAAATAATAPAVERTLASQGLGHSTQQSVHYDASAQFFFSAVPQPLQSFASWNLSWPCWMHFTDFVTGSCRIFLALLDACDRICAASTQLLGCPLMSGVM
eukprot:411054-Pelagomonas_calceolata.AAC.1